MNLLGNISSFSVLMFLLEIQFELTSTMGQLSIKRFPFNRQRSKHSRFEIANRLRRNQHRTAATGRRKAGIKGHAIINGEYTETNKVLLQKTTLMGVGYFPYGKPKLPVYIRTQKEINKKFVVFQDPYLPPGEGYLVVLRKIPPQTRNSALQMLPTFQQVPSEIPYEAYHLQLSNNIHGSIDRLNVRRLAYNIRTQFYERNNTRLRWAWNNRRAHSRQRFRMVASKSRGLRRMGKRSINNIYEKDLFEQIPMVCHISRLNVTQVRMRSELSHATHTSINVSQHELMNDEKIDDFEYFT